MARRPRFALTGLPLHVVQRGNDRQRCFFVDGDYEVYLKALREAAIRHTVEVNAYVLMTNHVHLLVTAGADRGVSRFMQSIGACYVRYFNRRHQRTGTLWEGRYKACLVATDEHLLAACRYIDLNPVRAGIVQHPAAYRWSSYRALAARCDDRLVTPHAALSQLGPLGGSGYANWCSQAPRADEMERLRVATANQSAFGSEAFRIRVTGIRKSCNAERQKTVR
jgi:putative transposase